MSSKQSGEFDGLLEQSLDEIQEDIFFRADNFKSEKWYEAFQMYRAIGVCRPEKEDLLNVQKALKIMGYATQLMEQAGKILIVPQRNIEKPMRENDAR